MPPTKRVLLVASSFGDLQGPEHDLNTMTKALKVHGFNHITMCVTYEATHENILGNWNGLIKDLEEGDVVAPCRVPPSSS